MPTVAESKRRTQSRAEKPTRLSHAIGHDSPATIDSVLCPRAKSVYPLEVTRSPFAMKYLMRSRLVRFDCLAAVLTAASLALLRAQTPEPLNWTAQQDHKNMMEQLGITRLRPGPSGNPGATNSANYDPAKANPFPDLPEILTLKNGQRVTTPEMWWKQRRPEIAEDVERESYG